MKMSFSSPSLSDLHKGESEEICYRNWSIDCPKMIIKKKTKENPETYYGSGEIKISKDSLLTFKLFSNREKNTKEWHFGFIGDSGKIIPDDVYYFMKAVDIYGRNWTSDRILPSLHRTATGRFILTGNLDELTTMGRYPLGLKMSGSSINYWVFDDFQIPCNASSIQRKSVARGKQTLKSASRNAWSFRSYKSKFLVVKESKDLLTITITSKIENLPVLFPARVIEAFQFVIGYPIKWGIMRHRNGNQLSITIRSIKDNSISLFQPPLPSTLIQNTNIGKDTTEYHRRLFDRYLKYTLKDENFHHPIWGKLNAIYEASSASFVDAEALTLTVAIESLLGSEFPNLGYPTRNERKEIENIVRYISIWDGDKGIKNRVKGILSNLDQPRAADRMHDLIKRKAISEDQYKAWQRLRNPSTHTYQASGIETQEFLELIQQCKVLFYHLIFVAIGYRGPYMDYSTIGWPLKKYPGNTLWGK